MAVLFPGASDIALLALRVVIGVLFAAGHGYGKLFKGGFAKTVGFVGSMGFKPAAFWALLLGGTEFFGGLALALGFATRAAAALLMVVMLVALYHKISVWKNPFKGGWELDLALLAGLAALFLLGAGSHSFDYALGWVRLG